MSITEDFGPKLIHITYLKMTGLPFPFCLIHQMVIMKCTVKFGVSTQVPTISGLPSLCVLASDLRELPKFYSLNLGCKDRRDRFCCPLRFGVNHVWIPYCQIRCLDGRSSFSWPLFERRWIDTVKVMIATLAITLVTLRAVKEDEDEILSETHKQVERNTWLYKDPQRSR